MPTGARRLRSGMLGVVSAPERKGNWSPGHCPEIRETWVVMSGEMHEFDSD